MDLITPNIQHHGTVVSKFGPLHNQTYLVKGPIDDTFRRLPLNHDVISSTSTTNYRLGYVLG